MVVDMETTAWHGPLLLQDGCHSSGWYEDALRQIFWCSSNLPLGWRGRERGAGSVAVSGDQSATYSHEDDAGWLHGVLGGQDDPAVIDSTLKLRPLRTADGEVPFKEVLLRWEERGSERWPRRELQCAVFTSSGWAKYIGVGFLSSIASLMSRFTAAGKTHSHEGIVSVLSRVQRTWTSHVVFLLHLCCFAKPL